jgi:lactate dehydrogenase-like 2-hydroxyacid dehydrogenase
VKQFKYVSQDELLQQSDVISIHTPLTKETRHLINKDSIAKMKKGKSRRSSCSCHPFSFLLFIAIFEGVLLVNTSRGQLIDTRALLDALKTGQISAAGISRIESHFTRNLIATIEFLQFH